MSSHDLLTLKREYLDYLEGVLNYSDRTIATKLSGLRLLRIYLNNKDVEEVKLEEILEFSRWLRYRKGQDGFYSVSSINCRMTVVKAFFHWCEEVKGLKVLNYRLIPVPKTNRGRIHYLDHQEYERLIKPINVHTFEGLRLRAYIEVSISTGARLMEMLNMKLTDINWEQNEIIVKGKGNKFRSVYLTSYAKTWLLKYIQVRDDRCTYLWVACQHTETKVLDHRALWHQFKVVRDKSALPWVSPHTLRHTFATTLLHNGANIREVQELMGHASINSTMIYTHYTDMSLKNAHQKYLKI